MKYIYILFLITVHNALTALQIGDSIHGFTVTNSQAIERLSYHFTELEHKKSGAKIVHVEAPDPENFFCVSFCTPNTSSDGVAHVLEHAVLQGSRKYPSTNLFYELTKNSLGSYINAATSRGYTFYPIASAVDRDFYNLLDVYLDAVFHPLLTPDAFYREGCRVEFADDSQEKLTYKGIVYNEMKGANASPLGRLHQKVSYALFPDTPLKHNYGGNIDELIGLSYDTFVQFHKNHYYPGNAFIFFYGNIALERHLAFLEKLDIFDSPKKEPAAIPKQTPLANRLYQTHHYPCKSDDDQTLMTIGWVPNIQETEELAALEVLNAYLLQNDTSILKNKLLKSGLCSDVYGILDSTKAQAQYEIILEATQTHDTHVFESLIFETLQTLCSEGIDPNLIDGACQSLLLQAYDPAAGSKPTGLILFYQFLQQKNLGLDIQDALVTHQFIEKIQEKAKTNPLFFSDLIKKHFLDNTHSAFITMLPSSKLLQTEHLQEENVLREIAKKHTQEEKQVLIERAKRLRDSEAESKKVVPFGKALLEDLAKNERRTALQKERIGAADVFYKETLRKGIADVALVLHLPDVRCDDAWLYQLYADLLPEVGWGKSSASQTLEYIQKHIANLHTTLTFVSDVDTVLFTKGQLHIIAKVFDNKLDALFRLFSQFLEGINFEPERVGSLVHRYAVSMQNSLNTLSFGYAKNAALLGQSPYFCLTNQSSGLGYYQMLQKIDRTFSDDGVQLCQKLASLHQRLLSCIRPHVLMCASSDAYMASKIKISDLFSNQNFSDPEFQELQGEAAASESTAFVIPSAVCFNAQGIKTLHYSHPQSPYLALAAALSENCVLTSSLRKQGGAYGASVLYNPNSGAFVLSSYRDPHITRTANVFAHAFEMLSFDDVDIQEAKISLLQILDRPRKPFEEMLETYTHLCGKKNDEMRKWWRNTLLKATKEDVYKAIAEHLIPQFKKSTFVTFAPLERIEQEKQTALLPFVAIQDIF